MKSPLDIFLNNLTDDFTDCTAFMSPDEVQTTAFPPDPFFEVWADMRGE